MSEFYDIFWIAKPDLLVGHDADRIYALAEVTHGLGGVYWHGHATEEQYMAITKSKDSSLAKSATSVASRSLQTVKKKDVETDEPSPVHVYGSSVVDKDAKIVYHADRKNEAITDVVRSINETAVTK